MQALLFQVSFAILFVTGSIANEILTSNGHKLLFSDNFTLARPEKLYSTSKSVTGFMKTAKHLLTFYASDDTYTPSSIHQVMLKSGKLLNIGAFQVNKHDNFDSMDVNSFMTSDGRILTFSDLEVTSEPVQKTQNKTFQTEQGESEESSYGSFFLIAASVIVSLGLLWKASPASREQKRAVEEFVDSSIASLTGAEKSVLSLHADSVAKSAKSTRRKSYGKENNENAMKDVKNIMSKSQGKEHTRMYKSKALKMR